MNELNPHEKDHVTWENGFPPTPLPCPGLGPDSVLLQSELRFNVTSSELLEIVQRLFASPLCIFHFQHVAICRPGRSALHFSPTAAAAVLLLLLHISLGHSPFLSSVSSSLAVRLTSPSLAELGPLSALHPSLGPAVKTRQPINGKVTAGEHGRLWRGGGFISSVSGGPPESGTLCRLCLSSSSPDKDSSLSRDDMSMEDRWASAIFCTAVQSKGDKILTHRGGAGRNIHLGRPQEKVSFIALYRATSMKSVGEASVCCSAAPSDHNTKTVFF